MTKEQLIQAIQTFAAEQKDEADRLKALLREEKINLDSKDEILLGLRSIEASLQADLKVKRDIIQAQSERIIELAAYRDELRAENTKLKLHVATDQNIVKRNLEMVDEIADLKQRNKALEDRCFALDNRVVQQKEELDGLKFAMHKAGL
jgi:hypothetical protein